MVYLLLLNEGALGAGMLGHRNVGETLMLRLAEVPGIDARLATVPPMGRVAALLTDRGSVVAGLDRFDPDLQRLRWHATQAARVRRLVRRELRSNPVDVLHVHSHAIALGVPDVVGRLPTFVSVDATVTQWRELGPDRHRPGRSLAPVLALERRVFERAHTVLAWSAWAEQGIRASAPAANVVRHDPGFDVRRFTPVAARSQRARPRALFVGGDFARKGGGDLLLALEPLLGHAIDLDIVTSERLDPRPGVRVHRLAPGDDGLVELHQQADMFCLPTHQDASPWALREAMACGAAVVSCPVGAIPDFLDNGRAGRLVAPGDLRALRETVRLLAGDEPLRRQLGKAARARCERLWDSVSQSEELAGLVAAAGGRARSR